MLAKDLGLERVALVANKIRDDHELAAVHEFADQHGLDVVGVIPFDEQLPKAERAQRAPLDFAPNSPAVEAIRALAQEIAKAPLAAPPSGAKASPAHRLK